MSLLLKDTSAEHTDASVAFPPRGQESVRPGPGGSRARRGEAMQGRVQGGRHRCEGGTLATCRGTGQINNYVKDKGWQVSHRQSYQHGNRKRKRNLVMNENSSINMNSWSWVG